MGYETKYKLECKQDLIILLRAKFPSAEYALTPSGETNEPSKWYEYEKDLKAFSKEHPKEIFKLSGYGEEAEDIWRQYFRNGKTFRTKANITFEPFDIKRLK